MAYFKAEESRTRLLDVPAVSVMSAKESPLAACAPIAFMESFDDTEENVIIPETMVEVSRQEDIKDVGVRLSVEDCQDFENKMDETLEAGDLDDIIEWITPHKLTQCATNCLEKSLEVSHKLNRLANSKCPDAENVNALAKSVEVFAVHLLEPLKSDNMKRAIFEGEDFDRVLDKAVKHKQKKFLSHPVVYNLLRRRWTGNFSHLRYGKDEKSWLKWFFLNFWTILDIFLFPVVYSLLWLIQLFIGFATKRQDLRVVFIFNASRKYANRRFQVMQSISKDIMNQLQSDKIQYATITRGRNGPIVNQFTTSGEAIRKMPVKLDVEPTREMSNDDDVYVEDSEVFVKYLKKAEKLFQETKEGSNKVVVVMTDDKFGAPSNKLLKAVRSLRQQQIEVVSVGLGVHLEIKELEIMAMKEENVVLIFNDESNADKMKERNRILKSIKRNDIFDRYIQYFTTPCFIFIRDTLSYLALLGLHFAMCLQPSTLHFTAIEWIIAVFFLGRFMMEINQVITEKDLEWPARKELSRKENTPNMATSNKEPKYTHIISEEEDEPSVRNNKKALKWKELWTTVSNYFNDWWNILDVLTLTVFLIVIGLRVFIWAEHDSVSKNGFLAVAGYLYGLNAMLLTLRVFGHIMEYQKFTGSIQIALFQIVGAVIAMCGQILAATIAFSLAITKIYIVEMSYNSGTNGTSIGLCENQNGFNCWWNYTTYLFWSLLGITELTPLESSDHFSDGLAKILYGLFLIMGVVMLLNMMVAMLTNTYQNVVDNAFYEWSYKKATTIITYNKYHPVPVPFNIISLSFKLLLHIYRTINCTRCKGSRHSAILNMTATFQTELEMSDRKTKRTEKKKESLFECLIADLQTSYFAKCGYEFPKAEDSKMDQVLKETEGNHQLIGHIAQRAFRYDKKESQRLESHGHPEWDARGIEISGQRLVHATCKCTNCVYNGESTHHGAKYLNPLSKEYPEFEVLIQERGERRFIVIGVVTKNYEIHKFPGCEGNTVGYHIDEGKIFDNNNSVLGKNGDDAMADRGDLIGCKILYDKRTKDKLPVSFSRNNRVIGEANLTVQEGVPSGPFYPYVGTGCTGISLLFRMCPKVSLPDKDSEPGIRRMLDAISEQLQTIGVKQAELEQKIDLLSKP